MTRNKKNTTKKNAGLSMFGVSVDDALRAAMNTKPMPKSRATKKGKKK